MLDLQAIFYFEQNPERGLMTWTWTVSCFDEEGGSTVYFDSRIR